MPTTDANQEVLLDQLLRESQNEKAVALICRLAIESAERNDFEQAEKLRDRLYEVDSMALTEILRVNESIESEKSKVLTPDRKQLWVRFVDGLSNIECNAFFTALREQRYEAEEIILRQGEPSEKLYLVDSGQLKMTHFNLDKDQLIRKIGAGEIFGEDTFFSVNVCTFSVAALVPVRLSYIDRRQLDQLKTAHPCLESNLQKICRSGQSVYDLMRQKGIDRRAHGRINLHTKILFQILTPDNPNSLQRVITAELWDISKKGLSFYFQSKHREAVRRLIGRTLGIELTLPVDGKIKKANLTGIVQGVQNHPLDEYSVHVQLNREFSHQAIQTIHRIAAAQSKVL
jgi:hypothetical protein